MRVPPRIADLRFRTGSEKGREIARKPTKKEHGLYQLCEYVAVPAFIQTVKDDHGVDRC